MSTKVLEFFLTVSGLDPVIKVPLLSDSTSVFSYLGLINKHHILLSPFLVQRSCHQEFHTIHLVVVVVVYPYIIFTFKPPLGSGTLGQ